MQPERVAEARKNGEARPSVEGIRDAAWIGRGEDGAAEESRVVVVDWGRRGRRGEVGSRHAPAASLHFISPQSCIHTPLHTMITLPEAS